jgi:hypothetical protein
LMSTSAENSKVCSGCSSPMRERMLTRAAEKQHQYWFTATHVGKRKQEAPANSGLIAG